MISDPRRAMWISVAIALAAGLWLLSQWVFSEDLFDVMGYALYASDFVAVFALITAFVVAMLFRRFARVRDDLQAGRNVVGRWTVSAADFKTFAGVALKHDREDKWGVLLLITGFVVVIFGAFAIFDPEVAAPMLTIGALVIIVMGIAFLWSGRIMRKQLGFRTGEVIVGRDGLLVNGALHVWGVPMSWLANAARDERVMTVTYAFLIRFGVQMVDVLLPVPPEAEEEADKAVAALSSRGR